MFPEKPLGETYLTKKIPSSWRYNIYILFCNCFPSSLWKLERWVQKLEKQTNTLPQCQWRTVQSQSKQKKSSAYLDLPTQIIHPSATQAQLSDPRTNPVVCTSQVNWSWLVSSTAAFQVGFWLCVFYSQQGLPFPQMKCTTCLFLHALDTHLFMPAWHIDCSSLTFSRPCSAVHSLTVCKTFGCVSSSYPQC